MLVTVGRPLKLVALVVFVAVLIILLTPADDGPAMSLRDQVTMILFLGLLAVAVRVTSAVVPRFAPVILVAGCRAASGQARASNFVPPLLC